MPIDYASRRKKREQAAASFSPVLRENIALRNVDAVVSLLPVAQRTLADAIQKGIKRIPTAIQRLKIDPECSLETLLLEDGLEQTERSKKKNVSKITPITVLPSGETVARLSRLIQTCYPDMPDMAASALAESPAMNEVLKAMDAHEAILDAAMSDFVLAVFFALLKESSLNLEKIISENPVFQQAISKLSLR